MKEVLNIEIGGRSFIINEDAYERLNVYLNAFRSKTGMGYQTREVMDDLEMRIAEIFTESLSSMQEVVDMRLVERVIAQLGMPDGSEDSGFDTAQGTSDNYGERPVRRLYRDVDHKALGGVAAGLACYLNLDVVVVRIVFVCLLLFGSFGFWLYVILWLAVPAAVTGADKCRMHGLPVTAWNIRRFHNEK